MEDEVYKISQVSKYIFEFPSIGKKHLLKQVSFDEIEYGIYNAALGTVLEDGSVNFTDSTNNGDIVKVFSTVINCIKKFANDFPDKVIYFTGNTEQKTRVYNEILRRYYDEFSGGFHIFGMYIIDDRIKIDTFDISRNYAGFYLKRKINILL